MIHYHGTPIGGDAAVATAALNGGHAFVSFRAQQHLDLALSLCQSVALDNGAFTAWKSGKPITDWHPFYEWIESVKRIPVVDFAVIPDVIDGSESDNDALLREWPHGAFGAPVWHMHESLERLERLASEWPRVCLGSSGEFSLPGTSAWWQRMSQAMDVVTVDGLPKTKLHGLRMLNPKVFQHLPLASADSTNLARNVTVDQKWKGTYLPHNNVSRAVVLRGRIEAFQGSRKWSGIPA